MNGHSDAVRSLAVLSDDKIISDSKDNAIKIWDINKGDCIKTLNGHSDAVLSVAALENDKIISGSVDNAIKIWDINTGDCIKTLNGHSYSDEVTSCACIIL